jgi:hypothetical protein
MADNEVKFASGGTGSKEPRLELIPYEALIRMAKRFELGIERRPDGSAWNALSENFHRCLTDKPFILARAAHTAQHAMKLKAILAGEMEDDGDDHAGAVLWGGAFLACATKLTQKEPVPTAWVCPKCGLFFKTEVEFKTHVWQEHNGWLDATTAHK